MEQTVSDNASTFAVDQLGETGTTESGSIVDRNDTLHVFCPPDVVPTAEIGKETFEVNVEQTSAENTELGPNICETSPKEKTNGRVCHKNKLVPTVSTQTSADVKAIPTKGDDPPIKKQCFEEINHLHVKLDDFSVIDKIGEGGFGEVFRGMYLGTPIAVKKVKSKTYETCKAIVAQRGSGK